jgi:hypothetical protein
MRLIQFSQCLNSLTAKSTLPHGLMKMPPFFHFDRNLFRTSELVHGSLTLFSRDGIFRDQVLETENILLAMAKQRRRAKDGYESDGHINPFLPIAMPIMDNPP